VDEADVARRAASREPTSRPDGSNGDRRVRIVLGTVAAIQVVVGALFILHVPAVAGLLPFPGSSDVSDLFVASMLWAAAVPVGWCLFVRSDRAFTGIFLDYLVILLPVGVLSLGLGLRDGSGGPIALAVGAFAVSVFAAWMLRWARRHPWRSAQPTPRPVLGAFAIFVGTLVIVGGLLIAGTPGILPWPVTRTLSTLYGLMFLGAAAYFAYGLVDRRWENAGGQLAGFLAYDVVLIVPFVVRLVTGEPSYYGTTGETLRLNLIGYTLVIAFSAAVAVVYLFVVPETRILGRRPAATPQTPTP
jgi:hypothetical protein